MKIGFMPVEDRILVKRTVAREKITDGGIIIPDTAVEPPRRGIVIAIGPGRMLDNGALAPMYLHVGDEVIYGKFSGADIETEVGTFACMKQGDVFCVVVREDAANES